jgi:hypothetical protein
MREPSQLEDIYTSLKSLSGRGFATWLIKHSEDEETLQRLHKQLEHSMDLFHVRSLSFRPMISEPKTHVFR